MTADRPSDSTASTSGFPARGGSRSRRAVVRNALVFQIKLGLDGLKDVILAPLSIAAAVLDLIQSDAKSGHFDRVLDLGHRFDRWLDLYDREAGGQRPPPSEDER